MNCNTNIRKIEKIRLKLFKKIIELEKEMDNCPLKQYLTIQFEYGVTYRKLLKVEKIIKEKYPNITNELDYIDQINYRKMGK